MAVLCVYVADLSLTVALTFLGSRLSTCNGHTSFPSAISSSPANTPATPVTPATPSSGMDGAAFYLTDQICAIFSKHFIKMRVLNNKLTSEVLKSCPRFEQQSSPCPQLVLQLEYHICSGTPEVDKYQLKSYSQFTHYIISISFKITSSFGLQPPQTR